MISWYFNCINSKIRHQSALVFNNITQLFYYFLRYQKCFNKKKGRVFITSIQMYRTRHLLLLSKLFYSTTSSPSPLTYVAEHLKERTLLRITGGDAPDYLQGLITNDIQHIQRGGCMYSMFLNTKGRVLYDTIIYKITEPNAYLIECDVEVASALEKHLKIYRLRRKVDVNSLEQDYKVFALFNPEQVRLSVVNRGNKKLDGIVFPCDQINKTLPESVTTTRSYKDLLIYHDPRVFLLGSRVISPKSADVKSDLSEICMIENDEEEKYKWALYTLGVGEGVRDLPPGNCFPLEANCDYLHGVSFHKGCYIGQELTARTNHTGVVRKRLMPLIFSKVPGKMPESEVVMHEGTNLGKLRGIKGDAGLALLRVAKCLDLAEIQIGNGVAHTLRPSWWPMEASKEKIVQRNE